MTKSELIMRLAERNEGLLQQEAERIVSTIFDEIAGAWERGDRCSMGQREGNGSCESGWGKIHSAPAGV